MARKTINLLILRQEETLTYRRLRKTAPIIAGIFITLFLIAYLVSLVYISSNVRDYNNLKSQVENLENSVAQKKATEGVYLATVNVLDLIKKIKNQDSEKVAVIFPELYNLANSNTYINTASIDNKGNVNINLTSYSLDSLEELVNQLKQKEETANFNSIKAHGILREKDGSYTLTIALKVMN